MFRRRRHVSGGPAAAHADVAAAAAGPRTVFVSVVRGAADQRRRTVRSKVAIAALPTVASIAAAAARLEGHGRQGDIAVVVVVFGLMHSACHVLAVCSRAVRGHGARRLSRGGQRR